MSRLKVEIEVSDEGSCIACMTFCKQELEAEGSTPSEALQNLSETLALYEQDEESLPEEISANTALYRYMSS